MHTSSARCAHGRLAPSARAQPAPGLRACASPHARARRATCAAGRSQQRFESTLDEVINRIRQRKGASEKMMDLAFRQHMDDKDVQAALGTIRRQMCARARAPAASAPRARPAAAHPSRLPWPPLALRRARSAPSLSGSARAGGSGSGPPAAPVRVPPSLTKDKLKEVMVFNAVQLEKDLAPVRKQLAEVKKTSPGAQVNPQVIIDLQQRISDAVRARFGYTDEQVMAAVEKYGAKEDPGFKDVLARISTTLNSALQP